MKPLESDEKTALVMFYTATALIRGEIVVKINQRVNIWLRSLGVPNYIHIHKAQVISFIGAPPRNSSFSEMFLPAAQVLGFHLVPPAEEPLDYEEGEAMRMMQAVDVVIGTFVFKGKARSKQTASGPQMNQQPPAGRNANPVIFKRHHGQRHQPHQQC